MNEKGCLIEDEISIKRYDFGKVSSMESTGEEDSLTITNHRVIRSVRKENYLYRKEVLVKDIGQVECRVGEISYKEVSLKQTIFPRSLLIPVIVLSVLLVLVLAPMYIFLSVDNEGLELVSNISSALCLCALIVIGIVVKVKGRRGTIASEDTLRPSRYILLLFLPFIYLLGVIGLLIFAGNKWSFDFAGPLLGYVWLIVLALADIGIFCWCVFGIQYEPREKTLFEIAILARGNNERLIVVESEDLSFEKAEEFTAEIGATILRVRSELGDYELTKSI